MRLAIGSNYYNKCLVAGCGQVCAYLQGVASIRGILQAVGIHSYASPVDHLVANESIRAQPILCLALPCIHIIASVSVHSDIGKKRTSLALSDLGI